MSYDGVSPGAGRPFVDEAVVVRNLCSCRRTSRGGRRAGGTWGSSSSRAPSTSPSPSRSSSPSTTRRRACRRRLRGCSSARDRPRVLGGDPADVPHVHRDVARGGLRDRLRHRARAATSAAPSPSTSSASSPSRSSRSLGPWRPSRRHHASSSNAWARDGAPPQPAAPPLALRHRPRRRVQPADQAEAAPRQDVHLARLRPLGRVLVRAAASRCARAPSQPARARPSAELTARAPAAQLVGRRRGRPFLYEGSQRAVAAARAERRDERGGLDGAGAPLPVVLLLDGDDADEGAVDRAGDARREALHVGHDFHRRDPLRCNPWGRDRHRAGVDAGATARQSLHHSPPASPEPHLHHLPPQASAQKSEFISTLHLFCDTRKVPKGLARQAYAWAAADREFAVKYAGKAQLASLPVRRRPPARPPRPAIAPAPTPTRSDIPSRPRPSSVPSAPRCCSRCTATRWTIAPCCARPLASRAAHVTRSPSWRWRCVRSRASRTKSLSNRTPSVARSTFFSAAPSASPRRSPNSPATARAATAPRPRAAGRRKCR